LTIEKGDWHYMELSELTNIISCGEDSTHQFKRNITNNHSLSAEMVAFSNSKGGKIVVGVADTGEITGLTTDDIRNLNHMISNVASEHIKPAINPFVENVMTDKGVVMVINIEEGANKPYQDNDGVFWVKCGADKRRATSREEIQRIFQKAHLLHADEIPVPNTTISDLDLDYFANFYRKAFKRPFESQTLPLPTLLENMNLLKDDKLTLAGTLLFANKPQFKLPSFIVITVAMNSYNISDDEYIDKRDIVGKISEVYSNTLQFILSNLRYIQDDPSFNSHGRPEIPAKVLAELIANALIHRDYFINASIRIFVMRDRVEIISPGHLPNNLTIENIINGNSHRRNSILASYAKNLMHFTGLGSGISRALHYYPDIKFIDDRDGNQFKVIIKRHEVVG